MGETLAETRVEIAARRADNERTASELDARVRHALDVKARFRENPLIFIGLGAGAVFLLAGGPAFVFGVLRRRANPSAAEQAYDALPAPMQAWVDTLISGTGPKAQKARDGLVEELARWRRDPIKDKKARKELARAMVDGPPGPSRTAWKAAETAAGLIAAALARRAIQALITGEKPFNPPKIVAPTPAASSQTDAGKPADAKAGTGEARTSRGSIRRPATPACPHRTHRLGSSAALPRRSGSVAEPLQLAPTHHAEPRADERMDVGPPSVDAPLVEAA